MTKNFDHAKARDSKARRTRNAHNQFINGRKRLGRKYAEGVA